MHAISIKNNLSSTAPTEEKKHDPIFYDRISKEVQKKIDEDTLKLHQTDIMVLPFIKKQNKERAMSGNYLVQKALLQETFNAFNQEQKDKLRDATLSFFEALAFKFTGEKGAADFRNSAKKLLKSAQNPDTPKKALKWFIPGVDPYRFFIDYLLTLLIANIDNPPVDIKTTCKRIENSSAFLLWGLSKLPFKGQFMDDLFEVTRIFLPSAAAQYYGTDADKKLQATAQAVVQAFQDYYTALFIKTDFTHYAAPPTQVIFDLTSKALANAEGKVIAK